MRKFLIAISIILFLYCVNLYFQSGIGNTLLLFGGAFAAITIYTIFFEPLVRQRWLTCLIGVVAAIYIGVGAFAVAYGRLDTANFTEDVAIVLGTGLRDNEPSRSLQYRLDMALEYHRRNPYAFIVVSGGLGTGREVTEAYAMARYLVYHGVPSEIILQEGNSHSTYQNMLFTREMIEELMEINNLTEIEVNVVVITNDFHIYRGTRFASRVGFYEVTSFHASTPLYAFAGSLIREVAAIFKMWIVGT